MKLSQRVARSEIHLYLQKLYNRGYKKTGSQTFKGGYLVTLERIIKGKTEVLTVKYYNNGWTQIY